MRVKSLHRYALLYCLSNLCLMCFVFTVSAASRNDTEHPANVRTVLVAKMINYTYWPSDKPHGDSEEVAICLIASSEKKLAKVEPYIRLLDNRNSDKGIIRVKSFVVEPEASIGVENQLPFDCRIFYFSELGSNTLVAIVNIAQRRGVLTISDSKENLHKGTMVAFIHNRGKLKLYINADKIDKSGVRLKSSILRIANRI